MALSFNTVPTKRLAQSIDASATAIKVNNILDWNGDDLDSATLGSRFYAVFRNALNTQIEIFELDPTTIADNSTTGVNILKRGLKFNGDVTTQVPEYMLTWVKDQTIVEFGTDVPQIFQNFVGIEGDQEIDGVKTFNDSPIVPVATNAEQAVNLGQLSSIITAGGVDASSTVKGVAQLTVDPIKTIGVATITIASPAVITATAHGLVAGDTVKFTTTGTLPTGIVSGNPYYVISSGITSNTFEISAVPLGTAVNTSGTQTGTHTLTDLTPRAVGEEDPRMLTQPENDAAAGGGTFGAPSNSNKFVTQAYLTAAGSVAIGGTGADGALNITTGTTVLNLGQVYNYTTINVSVGATLAFTGTGGATMNATGAITIAGTVELRGLAATSFSIQTSKNVVRSGTPFATVTAPNGEGGAGGQMANFGAQPYSGGTGGSSSVAGAGNGGAGGTGAASGSNGQGGATSVTGGGGGGGSGAPGTSNTGGTGGNSTTNDGGAGGVGATGSGSSGGGAGGGGGGGLLTGNGGNGGAGTTGSGTTGGAGGGGNGGNSGATGGTGGTGGDAGDTFSSGTGSHGNGPNGGNGGTGYNNGGNGGKGGASASYSGSSDLGGTGGRGGDALFGTGGNGGKGGATNENTGGHGGNGGNSRFGNGGNGGDGADNAAQGGDGNGGSAGFGGDGVVGGNGGAGGANAVIGFGSSRGTGGRGGDGGNGKGAAVPLVIYCAATISFTGTINAQGGNGGNGGQGGVDNGAASAGGSGGDGGNAGNGGDGADIVMLAVGAVTNTGTVNNAGGAPGLFGHGGISLRNKGTVGEPGKAGRNGLTVITQIISTM